MNDQFDMKEFLKDLKARSVEYRISSRRKMKEGQLGKREPFVIFDSAVACTLEEIVKHLKKHTKKKEKENDTK